MVLVYDLYLMDTLKLPDIDYARRKRREHLANEAAAKLSRERERLAATVGFIEDQVKYAIDAGQAEVCLHLEYYDGEVEHDDIVKIREQVRAAGYLAEFEWMYEDDGTSFCEFTISWPISDIPVIKTGDLFVDGKRVARVTEDGVVFGDDSEMEWMNE